MTLLQLDPGARFHIPGTGRTGTLLYANECRARVRYDGEDRHVELKDGTTFESAGRAVDISSGTEVERYDDERGHESQHVADNGADGSDVRSR